MTKYFIEGLQCTRGEAVRAWRASGTYRRAKKSTRELVFTSGEKGVEDGGTTNHLAEAGITIVHDTAIAGAAGEGK